MDYAAAGVDLNRSKSAKAHIAQAVRTTFSTAVVSDVGLFGGCFALDDNPHGEVLVASTDGVGTKLLLGAQLNCLGGLGRDLVHHSVNDILMCGARPMFFLDYLAFGTLDSAVVAQLVESLAAACRDHGVALIGGETAEMPGLYAPGHFDLAGTIVGRVSRDRIPRAESVRPGDVLIGITSSGPHTNGYSLIRKVFAGEIESDKLRHRRLPDGRSVADALMEPHRCYLPSLGKLLDHPGLRVMSHITGGGIVENTERVIPDSCALEIDWSAWPRPEIFSLIQEQGEVPEADMRHTFNLGIGAVAIVAPSHANAFAEALRSLGESVYTIGKVAA